MKNIHGSYHNSRSYLSKRIYAARRNIITYLQTFNMYESKTSLIVHNIVKIQRLNYPKSKINNRLFCLLVLFITEKLTHGKCTCQGPMVGVDFCFSINQNGYYLCWEINHFLRILSSDAYSNCWFLETQNSILASRDLIRVSQNSIRWLQVATIEFWVETVNLLLNSIV